MAEAKEKKVAKKEDNLPDKINFEEDAGAGFEDANQNSYAIPFLRQIQSLSPQLKKKNAEYIEGAEEGDFINTVTGELYKGDEGVLVVPCHYLQSFNEWEPNRGGFRGSHNPTEYLALKRETKVNAKGNPEEFNMETGNQLVDTREHYVVIINSNGSTTPALLAMSSSQIKVSKKWMTQMQNIRVNDKPAPMFSHAYKITATEEHNDQGDWAGMKITLVSQITELNKYNAAKIFREMVRSGQAQANKADEEVPF